MSKHKKINSDTAHRWCHQIGDYSEVKGGRLFFRGDTIYSYGEHFPIARHIKVKSSVAHDGFHRCILFTTRAYSVTTARHISEVSQAIPGGVTVFHVDNVRAGEDAESYPESATKQHQHNLDDYRERITNTAGNAKRARSNKNWYITRLDNLLNEHNGYIDFFQLKADHIFQGDPQIEQLLKNAKEASQREIEREKERKRQAEIRNQEDIQRWVAGKIDHFPFSVQRVYLRKDFSQGEQIVVTSKGAIVPLEHARKAFKVVQKCRERQKGFSPNGKTLHVGHYQIQSIDAEGNVRAGCHLIEWPQIEDFARKEGWLDATLEGDHPGEHLVVQDAINEAALHQ